MVSQYVAKFGSYLHCSIGYIIILSLSRDLARPHDYVVMRLYEWKLLMVSYHPAKFCHFSNFLQLRNQRSGSKTVCGFSTILILKGIMTF